jgi:outer membrane protein insertion porin family
LGKKITVIQILWLRSAAMAFLGLALAGLPAVGQVLQRDVNSADPAKEVSYAEPKDFTIAAINVTGIRFLDPDALVAVTGLKVGDKISLPGEAVSTAIRKLWEQGLLADVSIDIERQRGDSVWLVLALAERPRLSRFSFKGVRKGNANDLREKVHLTRGRVVTDALVKNTTNIVRRFFISKGYYNTQVRIVTVNDSSVRNTVSLRIEVDKGQKVKISTIEVVGNSFETDDKIRKKLKDTKQVNKWRIFKPSRYIASKYEADKEGLIAWYNKNGYRDASIAKDSVYRVDERHVAINLQIEEGRKYYFRDISWSGNYLYPAKTLSEVLGIARGDVYNQEVMDKKLNFNPQGADVSSLYMDDGYLFFRVTPTEVKVDGDSIDIEMRVYEGQQATINRVTLEGNTKTSDHVVLREIRTLPGQKFSRSELIRTQRELSQLGYFDPEQIGILPVPNPADGTVDIKYTVAEKPSDQIQLSGGWGGFYGFVGTLGLVFNNFSAKKIGQLSEWRPLPGGDGQRLAINFQANGRTFQNYTASFTEPWLGGKRANSFTVSLNRAVQRSFLQNAPTTVGSALNMTSLNVSLGRRLRYPDDYFVLTHSASFNHYNLFNYFGAGSDLPISTGTLNQIAIQNTLSRNSLNNPIFPTAGSSFTLSLNATPPYSLFNPNRGNVVNSTDKLRLVEFHKWMFDGTWFTSIAKNLVLNTRVHYGFLGYYSKAVGIGPFERFRMGGSGISGFNFLVGYDLIGLRGYQDNAIGPAAENGSGTRAGIIYNKYVTELRYAVSTNPAATIFILGFAEGGNNVGRFADFNPFNIYRSYGAGIRIMMPAFGLLGVDYGRAIDGPKSLHNNFTFTIGQQIR